MLTLKEGLAIMAVAMAASSAHAQTLTNLPGIKKYNITKYFSCWQHAYTNDDKGTLVATCYDLNNGYIQIVYWLLGTSEIKEGDQYTCLSFCGFNYDYTR